MPFSGISGQTCYASPTLQGRVQPYQPSRGSRGWGGGGGSTGGVADNRGWGVGSTVGSGRQQGVGGGGRGRQQGVGVGGGWREGQTTGGGGWGPQGEWQTTGVVVEGVADNRGAVPELPSYDTE